jgi:hypothetical protein
MTGVAPIDDVANSAELSLCWRVRTVQLEFGPHVSVPALYRAFGESLARSRLVAHAFELFPVAGGQILLASCDVVDEEPAVRDALACLLEGSDPPDSSPSRPGGRSRPCSLAP